MSRLALRLAFLLAAPAALTALAGCGDQAPVDAPPSAYESGRGPAEPPPLAGGPVGSFDRGLAGGPRELAPAERPLPPTPRGLRTWREPSGRLVTAMAPIPNPESLSLAERRRIYGEPRRAPARPPARVQARLPGAAAPATPARVAAPKPLAQPAPKPAAKVAAAPLSVPALPPPKTVAPPPAPVVAKPVATPELKAAAPAMPAPVQTPATRLTAALGSEAVSGSKLVTPEALAKGEPAEVTLTLPQTLLGAIQREAAKLGLARAARSAEVTATLSGDGYEITPNGAQTAKLKDGEAAAFAWQVKPGPGEKSPLKAKIDGALTGLRSPFNFSLGSLEQAIAAIKPPAVSAPGLKLPGFMLPTGSIELPGFGEVPAKTAIGGALLLLAVIILAVLARRASDERARAAARRRYRTMTSYGGDDIAPAAAEPERGERHGYVTPMVAAAAAGAVAAAAAHHHHKESEEAKADEPADAPWRPAAAPEPIAHAEAVHAETHEPPAVGPGEPQQPAAPAPTVAEPAHAEVEPGHAEPAPSEPAHAQSAPVEPAPVEAAPVQAAPAPAHPYPIYASNPATPAEQPKPEPAH